MCLLDRSPSNLSDRAKAGNSTTDGAAKDGTMTDGTTTKGAKPDRAETDRAKTNEDICVSNILDQWIKEEGVCPVTWGVLVDVLRHLGLQELATQIDCSLT